MAGQMLASMSFCMFLQNSFQNGIKCLLTQLCKKLISPLTMGVEKIDACRNHCILYRGNDYKDLDSCPNCGVCRYKMNKDYWEEENGDCVKIGKK